MLGVGRSGPLGPLAFGPGEATATTFGGALTATGSGAPGRAVDGSATAGRIAERSAWILLASVDGIGPAGFGSLVRRFGSAGAVLTAAAEPGSPRLRALPLDPEPAGASATLRLDDRLVDGLAAVARSPGRVLDDVERLQLVALTLEDDGYPAALRGIELAPPVLFIRGDASSLEGSGSVAVVGTRRPTDGGRRVAARIAGALARAGAGVVSGLAIGIDGAAHEAALAESGRTVAVLGAGHRHLTPIAHRGLAERIIGSGGAVVSEFAPTVAPGRGTFPRRNRIISGLCRATVVVEAAPGSGALITAAWALEQGRECFLVPGPLDAAAAVGCLRFLRDHAGLARIVAGIPELLEDLELTPGDASPTNDPLPELRETEGRIAELVATGRGTLDELSLATGLPVASVLGALTLLELRGLVVPVLGRYRPSGLLASRRPFGARPPGDDAVAAERAGPAR